MHLKRRHTKGGHTKAESVRDVRSVDSLPQERFSPDDLRSSRVGGLRSLTGENRRKTHPSSSLESSEKQQRIIYGLIDAIRSYDLSDVQRLLRQNKEQHIGASVNMPIDPSIKASVNVFTRAILSGVTDIVTYLMEHGGADIHLRVGSDKETPLHLAVYTKNIDVIRALLEHAAKTRTNMTKMVNTKDAHGSTPLHRLSFSYGNSSRYQSQNKEILNVLQEYGADVDAQDEDGNTLLHLAVAKGNPMLVTQLLESTARFDIKNHRGELAVDMSPLNRPLFGRQHEGVEAAKQIIRDYRIPSYGYKAYRKEDEAAELLKQQLHDLALSTPKPTRPKSSAKHTRRAKSSSSSTTSSSIESFTESTVSRKSRKSRKLRLPTSTTSSPMSSLSPGTPSSRKSRKSHKSH